MFYVRVFHSAYICAVYTAYMILDDIQHFKSYYSRTHIIRIAASVRLRENIILYIDTYKFHKEKRSNSPRVHVHIIYIMCSAWVSIYIYNIIYCMTRRSRHKSSHYCRRSLERVMGRRRPSERVCSVICVCMSPLDL